ncbi:MAG TPA: hypothetical protein VL426_02395 [Candidatus Binatia bacterium]|jgi:hypothetical protein|nr:hypothetical protein [Candidatus Binatia bacterium]
MQDLREVFINIQSKKKERKELTKMFQDELKHNGEYQELVKQIKTLREKKRSIEDQAKASALHDVKKLDGLKEEISGSTELLTDIALTKFLNREQVEIVDEENNRLVPQFSVRFKKEEGESMTRQIEAERAASHAERTFAPA